MHTPLHRLKITLGLFALSAQELFAHPGHGRVGVGTPMGFHLHMEEILLGIGIILVVAWLAGRRKTPVAATTPSSKETI